MGINYVILFDEYNKDKELVGPDKTTTINAETEEKAKEKFWRSSLNHKYSIIKDIKSCDWQ